MIAQLNQSHVRVGQIGLCGTPHVAFSFLISCSPFCDGVVCSILLRAALPQLLRMQPVDP